MNFFDLTGLGTRTMRFIGFVAIAACLLSVSMALAAPDTALKPASTDTSNPLVDDGAANPLLEEDDPFIGTYKSASFIIVVRAAKDGSLEGTVQKGERTFPLVAKREGETLKGHFTHNDKHFAFTASLEGKTFLFTTSDRLFKLSREEPVKPAPPVPGPPVPAPPTPTPAPAPTPTPTPKPLQPEPAPAAQVVPPLSSMPIPKGAKANPGKSWAGFPKGTYVIMEEQASSTKSLPVITRSALVFHALEQDKEMILPHQFNGQRWAPIGVPSPWLGNGRTPEQLGYKPVKTITEAVDLGGTRYTATVTEYAFQDIRDGKPFTANLKMWTAKGLDFPSQPVILPEGIVRVEGPVIRVVRTGDDQTSLDFALATLNQPFAVGGTEILVASFKGTGTAFTPTGKLEVTIERWLSPQIPGGMAKLVIESTLGDTRSTTSGKAVAIGLSKVAE